MSQIPQGLNSVLTAESLIESLMQEKLSLLRAVYDLVDATSIDGCEYEEAARRFSAMVEKRGELLDRVRAADEALMRELGLSHPGQIGNCADDRNERGERGIAWRAAQIKALAAQIIKLNKKFDNSLNEIMANTAGEIRKANVTRNIGMAYGAGAAYAAYEGGKTYEAR